MSDDTHVDSAEPSMEDILASIRRIIADEDTQSEDMGEVLALENESIISAETLSSSETVPAMENITEQTETTDDILSLVDFEDDADAIISEETALDSDEVSDLDLLLSDIETEDGAGTDDIDIMAELDGLSDIELDEVAVSNAEASPPKLTGLGAIAAAGLGAVATAGAKTADGLKAARNNPVPKAASFDAESLSTDGNDESLDEALDLILDGHDLDSEPELEEFLAIPDSGDIEPEDDIDALLGDMLVDDEVPAQEPTFTANEEIIDPAADMLRADDGEGPEELSDELLAGLLGDDDFEDAELPASSQSSDDLDLVKSLMADLTDDPYDPSEAEVEDVSDTESELVDDILSLSLDDEVDLQGGAQDDAADGDAAAIEHDLNPSGSDPFVIDIREDLSSAHPAEPTRSSLAEIAQAAEAEAKRMERRSVFAATGFAAGAGMMVASSSAADSAAPEETIDETILDAAVDDGQDGDDIFNALAPSSDAADTDTDTDTDADAPASDDVAAAETDAIAADTTPQPNTEITPAQETADMAKAAAKKEAIVDNVTEEVAAGAFASLNQVVENKAVIADRGDRIGDLVQEALRPMLKEWLDKNLKGIVERAVTKEVKRISSGK